jgi:exonuclease SbcC
MKILTVKFRNINSLAGDWEIDFTKPEFLENGIFAITGKTGSGKSSILDAVSLALYGKTTRVDVTGSNNDVMTRGMSDCYAEITFEVGGKVWKASWKQERARKKADGNLKQVERVIADENDRIVADKISIKGAKQNEEEKTVNEKIVAILGLTFEQFTKVILLAQGSFAAFLQADKSDKGELLEQITGTEIYGEISRRVFERNKMENQKLEMLDRELGAITILSEEETEKLNREIVGLETQKEQIDKDLQGIVTTQNRLRELDTKIEEKKNTIHSIFESLKKIDIEKNKLSDDIQRKDRERKTISDGLIQNEEWKTKNAKYESLVGNYSAIENQNAQVQTLWNDWLAKQNDCKQALKDCTGQTAACENAVKDYAAKHQLHETKRQELEDQKKKSAEWLNGKELSVLQSEKEDVAHFGNTVKTLIENLKNSIANQKEMENCQQTIAENSAKENELNIQNTSNKNRLENLENQMDLLRENISFAKTIQSLEEHRKTLEDGKECPLCGATIHPFAIGNVPVVGEKEKQLQALNKQWEEIGNALKTGEKALSKAISDRENAERNKKTAEKNLSENQAKTRQILSETKNFNMDIREDNACLEKLEEIRTGKLEEWRKIDTLIKNAVQMDAAINKLRDEIIPQYQQAEKSAEIAKNESETARKLAEKAKENAENLTKQAKIQYETANAALSSKLTEYAVDTIEKLKQCRRLWIENENNRQTLSREKIELEGSILTTKSLLETNQKQFSAQNTEREQMEAAINELVAERKTVWGDQKPDDEEKKQQSDACSQKIGGTKQALEANRENLEKNRKKRTEKERQQQISDRWKRLDLLIGSADGKKYRNFAQALTFENLIVLTNKQLKKMSERYILKRTGDWTNPFELSVIDKFQNCDERTAQNLSGGEQFIVSLALALGLANMASRNMKIDTMFIDEGFGTLDSDYLNVALTALSNLQSEGKLIGVISHLAELKERIGTHIEVIPKGDGHSKLEIT